MIVVVRRVLSAKGRIYVASVVGAAICEGKAIAHAMPWLRLAELVGVGKHATFGDGRIAVEPLA